MNFVRACVGGHMAVLHCCAWWTEGLRLGEQRVTSPLDGRVNTTNTLTHPAHLSPLVFPHVPLKTISNFVPVHDRYRCNKNNSVVSIFTDQ